VFVVLAAVVLICWPAWEKQEKNRREYQQILDELRTRRERRPSGK
jgi:hypothetical protein